MIDTRTLTLLQSLSQTRSPSKQLSLIQEYCLYEADMTSQSDQVGNLLGFYKQQVEAAHQQGINAVSKRKKIVKSHEHPKFFPRFTGKGTCAHCNISIDGKREPVGAFFHRFGKEKSEVKIYCSLPHCFPTEHKDSMLEDRDYIKTVLKK